MSSENNLLQTLRKGVHIAIGATVSCVETLQDPLKRAEAINALQSEIIQKTKEWSVKGEVTETEVQTLIENLMAQRRSPEAYNSSSSNSPSSKNPARTNSRLQELTEEIIALKQELEKLRKSKGG